MPSPQVEVVVVALGTPLLVGVYKDGKLHERFESDEKTSEALPKIFKEILSRYDIKKIYYAKGPGSFMAIKLAYIFLETLRIAKRVELVGCEGFEFNNNAPIKAMGNLYFVKEGEKIVTKKLEDVKSGFRLPASTKELKCSGDRAPLYVLPAV
jgi:tRNA A37 threonylcarbamoyladenosine modification protein TsaB